MTRTVGLAPDMATFARLVDSRFRLRIAEETGAEVELTELKEGGSSLQYEQFSLVFRAPADMPPEQRIYELEHEATGTFELFLVPIGQTEDGLLLEAIISRRAEPAAGGD
jgi:hypothetical protein